MANFTEKGHAKNVANLGTLITFATGFGIGYNPSKKSISLPALNTLKEEAQKNLVVVNTHFNNWSVATEAQQALLAKLNARLTRVVNAAAACEVPPAALGNVKALNKKLQGTQSHKTAAPVVPEGAAAGEEMPKTISTSRMSYDSRLENLEKLVQLLNEQPGYTPNEPDLQLSALQTLLADFRAKNEAAKNAQMLLGNARISRNKYFYDKETGLVKVAANVKKYVKSVFGASSPEFKQVSGLSFSNQR